MSQYEMHWSGFEVCDVIGLMLIHALGELCALLYSPVG